MSYMLANCRMTANNLGQAKAKEEHVRSLLDDQRTGSEGHLPIASAARFDPAEVDRHLVQFETSATRPTR